MLTSKKGNQSLRGEVSMSERTAKNDNLRNALKNKRFALIAALLISICVGMGWYGMHDADAQIKMHNSVDMVSTKWSGTWNGWGVTGGKYGQFTCATCHSSSTTNIKRIKTSITVSDITKGNIPGSAATVSFMTVTGGTSAMGLDGATGINPATTRICQVCHSITKYNVYSIATQTVHNGAKDCTECHSHKNGFSGGDCIGCHQSVQKGVRTAVANQFLANSHHVQGVALDNTHCYNCHWEANADGSPNTAVHTQAPGLPVSLVVWTGTTRPTVSTAATFTAYFASGSSNTRAEYGKITAHCTGCHNETNKATKPFTGDTHNTSWYSWDGTSVALRYTQTGTTTWGKYATQDSTRKLIPKAYSAHGNAANNSLYWDTTNGYDSMLATNNFTGSTDIECFDCHNSHGSTASGVTTNYTSSMASGGILKDTTSGLGGYAKTYTPTAGGSAANHNVYNPGAALCFDCHMENAAASPGPWGYDTFGASRAIVGFQTSTYFGGATNYTGVQQRTAYAYKQGRGFNKGGHFGASSAINSTPTNTIKALCTPCHDPHGVSPTLNQAYSVPLLKGTWMTSPYKEDAAPANTTERRGGGSKTAIGYSFSSTPGWHLDQNTFSPSTRYSPGKTGWATAYSWPFYPLVTHATETDAQFAGLCLQCHKNDASAASIHTTTAGGWKTRDRIHNTVTGWAATSGTSSNVNNQVHSYTCSKCHSPHNSSQNRLMVTNCMNFTHRGRVAGGATWPAGPTNMTASGVQVNGTSGRGNGRFPGGGGGYASSSSGKNWSVTKGGAWFLGIAGTSGSGGNFPPPRLCHDNASGASGFGAWPTIELWNSRTTW